MDIADKVNFRNMMIEGIVGPAGDADKHYDIYTMLLAIHQRIDSFISGKKFKKIKPTKMSKMFPWIVSLRPAEGQTDIAKKAFAWMSKLDKENEDAGNGSIDSNANNGGDGSTRPK